MWLYPKDERVIFLRNADTIFNTLSHNKTWCFGRMNPSASSLSVPWVPCLFPRTERRGRGVNNSPSSSAEVENG
jgi:hypothetical protein